jgi:hypothetical protein
VHWSSFPQNGGDRRVTLPLGPACKAGASLIGHGPMKFAIWQTASVLPGVSRVLEAWQRADAQSIEITNHQSQIENELVRLPGIAPGRAAWQEAILLLNYNRGN